MTKTTQLAAGIVGLPNAGKSTLFNVLTHAGAEVASYPFCTIDPNQGVVPIPDPMLDKLAALLQPEKVTPATIRFVDIAGLVKNASKGEGLGNQFLGHIREVDALVHVVRCFHDPDVTHIYGDLDPKRDAQIVETELLLADVQTVERRMEKAERQAKSHTPQAEREKRLLEQLLQHLNQGRAARQFVQTFSQPSEQEQAAALVAELFLLTARRMVYVANMDEDEFAAWHTGTPSQQYEALAAHAREQGAVVVPIDAAFEQMLDDLSEEEAQEFLQEMGMEQTGLRRLLAAVLDVLELIPFYTVKGVETRSWLVRKGTTAPEAAGQIHSDMERGFIRAEVVPAEQLLAAGSFAAARERGWVRSEGRDYVVQAGDVVLFRFNV